MGDSKRDIAWILGVISAILAIFVFLTGFQSVGEMWNGLFGNHNPQPVSTNSISSGAQLTQQISHVVLAARGWQDTGVRVYAGDRIAVNYVAGTWTWTAEYSGFDALGDPNVSNTCGEICDRVAPGEIPVGQFCPIYNAPIGELVGKIGNGAPFSIGTNFTNTPPQELNGEQPLYLRMNDCDTGLHDNNGTLQVSIEVWR